MWKDLSMKRKASLIKEAVKHKITSLEEIQRNYEEGGYLEYMEKLAKKKARDWNEDEDLVLTMMLNDSTYDYKDMYDSNKELALKMLEEDSEAHFPDTYKTVYHPTFSNESKYSGKISDRNPKGTIGGTWNKNEYIPSNNQIKNKDFNFTRTSRYLKGTTEYIDNKYNKFAEGGELSNKNNTQNSYDLGGALSRFISRFTEEDTKDQYPTFNEAFRAARIAGKDYFKWNGELYNTELHPTVLEKQDLNILGVTKKQNDRMTDTWDYLRSNNVSARNAAAFMGNIMQESSFNPKARQIVGDKAVGLFQLHGDRLDDYKKFLQENNKEDDTHSQLDYMISLVKGERGDAYMDEYHRVRNLRDSLANTNNKKEYTEVLDYFNKMYKKRKETNTLYPIEDLTKAWEDETISLDSLTTLFTNTIERAGKPEHETRRNFANKFYNHFYGVPKLAPTK